MMELWLGCMNVTVAVAVVVADSITRVQGLFFLGQLVLAGRIWNGLHTLYHAILRGSISFFPKRRFISALAAAAEAAGECREWSVRKKGR